MKLEKKLEKMIENKVEEKVRKRFAKSLLEKNLQKFKRIILARSKDKYQGKADIYRRLQSFLKVVVDEIRNLEKELTEKKVEYFFNEDKQIVETVKDKEGNLFTNVRHFEKSVDWKKAIRKLKEENK